MMTKSEYIQLHKECCDKMVEITKRKNHDYSGGDSTTDPFLNFKAVEKLNICSVEQGFLTRMCDKMSRITTLTINSTSGNQVKDESVEDTLLDLANYSILLLGYLKSKKREYK